MRGSRFLIHWVSCTRGFTVWHSSKERSRPAKIACREIPTKHLQLELCLSCFSPSTVKGKLHNDVWSREVTHFIFLLYKLDFKMRFWKNWPRSPLAAIVTLLVSFPVGTVWVYFSRFLLHLPSVAS